MKITAANEIQYDGSCLEISLFINQGAKRQELADANANVAEPLAAKKKITVVNFFRLFLCD